MHVQLNIHHCMLHVQLKIHHCMLQCGYAHAPRWVPKKQSSNIFETFGYQSNHPHIISAESVYIDYYTTYLSIFC